MPNTSVSVTKALTSKDWDSDERMETGRSRKHVKCKTKKVHTKRRLAFMALSLMGVFVFLGIRSVPAAHTAVVTTFGAVGTDVLQSGLHFLNPFAVVVPFNLKTQILYTENVVPTKEGLNVEFDVSVLYHPDPESIRSLYLGVGEDYANILLQPELASAVRGLTSQVSAKALYTSGRTTIHDKLKVELVEKLQPRGVVIEDVLLKGIKLPKQLTDAIELKAQAEQEAARMEFVIQKEEQEANRKKIEAGGIASFQHIVSEGISEQLLQWKGIEATEALAQSPNSKIVIVGNSKDSLPVLLSSGNSAPQP